MGWSHHRVLSECGQGLGRNKVQMQPGHWAQAPPINPRLVRGGFLCLHSHPSHPLSHLPVHSVALGTAQQERGPLSCLEGGSQRRRGWGQRAAGAGGGRPAGGWAGLAPSSSPPAAHGLGNYREENVPVPPVADAKCAFFPRRDSGRGSSRWLPPSCPLVPPPPQWLSAWRVLGTGGKGAFVRLSAPYVKAG